MQGYPEDRAEGSRRFFLISLLGETAHGHYTMNHELRMRWHLSLSEIEAMIPFEREIYVALAMQELEKRKNEN